MSLDTTENSAIQTLSIIICYYDYTRELGRRGWGGAGGRGLCLFIYVVVAVVYLVVIFFFVLFLFTTSYSE